MFYQLLGQYVIKIILESLVRSILLIALSQEIAYEVHLGIINGGHANLVIVEVDLGEGRIHFTVAHFFKQSEIVVCMYTHTL